MYAGQPEEAGLESGRYVEVLARTLAALYWKAGVNGDDVESVLAPLRQEDGRAGVIVSDFWVST
jgi:hypothetical protein